MAFKKVIERSEKKENRRDSTKEILNKFKERVKNMAVKDKVKKNVMNKRDKRIRHLREILDVFFIEKKGEKSFKE